MQRTNNEIDGPILRYYGSKWSLAPWIISHFPPHVNYHEPCGGAGAVLLQKERSPLETFNDLDGEIANFFRVLRDFPDELLWAITFTPWSREEFNKSLNVPADADAIERARLLAVQCWQSMAGGRGRWDTTWRVLKDRGGRWANLSDDMNRAAERILSYADRLRGVQIESLDALDSIQKYDNKDALHYVDPPYPKETRGHQADSYAIEPDRRWYRGLLDCLDDCQGMVVLSSYADEHWDLILESRGWRAKYKETRTNSGGRRTELLWLSPMAWRALEGDFGPLFNRDLYLY